MEPLDDWIQDVLWDRYYYKSVGLQQYSMKQWKFYWSDAVNLEL